MMRTIVILLIYFLSTQSALSCACCAERGERFTVVQDRADYVVEELSRLASSGSALMFVTACDLECVKGIPDPQYSYDFNLTLLDWTLTLNSTAPSGQISVVLPDKFAHFAVDPSPMSETNPVDLYTELRFIGEMQGTGAFAKVRGAKAEFVLAGRANHCWQSSDFSHWSLQGTGKNINFRLFGALATQ